MTITSTVDMRASDLAMLMKLRPQALYNTAACMLCFNTRVVRYFFPDAYQSHIFGIAVCSRCVNDDQWDVMQRVWANQYNTFHAAYAVGKDAARVAFGEDAPAPQDALVSIGELLKGMKQRGTLELDGRDVLMRPIWGDEGSVFLPEIGENGYVRGVYRMEPCEALASFKYLLKTVRIEGMYDFTPFDTLNKRTHEKVMGFRNVFETSRARKRALGRLKEHLSDVLVEDVVGVIFDMVAGDSGVEEDTIVVNISQ